jgi:hypothetical protein
MGRRLRYFLLGLAIACPMLPGFTIAERGVSAYPGTVRWHDTRIDPASLFEELEKIPGVHAQASR